MKARDHLEDLDVDERMIKYTAKKVGGIRLDQPKDKWWPFVNTIINLRLP